MSRKEVNESLIKVLRELGAKKIEFYEDGTLKNVEFDTNQIIMNPYIVPYVPTTPGTNWPVTVYSAPTTITSDNITEPYKKE